VRSLLSSAAVLVATATAIALLGDAAAHIHAFLALYAIAFAAWAFAARAALRRPVPLALVVAVAIAARLPLLLAPPSLSDDLWRYLWEGRVQHIVGFAAPYLYAPTSPALDGVFGPERALVNHPDVPAAYPPGAQLFFFVVTTVAAHPTALKLALVLAEVAAIVLLGRALAARGLSPGRALLYAWNPLALVEVAGSGHLEGLGVFALAAALHFESRARPAATGAALAFGAMVKLVPAPLLPFAASGPAATRRALAAAAAAGLLLALPYAGAAAALPGGLGAYASRWRHNDSLFAALDTLFGEDTARPAAAALFAALWLALLVRHARAPAAWPLARAGLWLMGAYLLLAPTVHPWYVLWLLPFLCFHPVAPWLLFTGTVALTYLALPEWRTWAVWAPPPWVPLVEYVPLYTGLALAALASFRRRRPPPVTPVLATPSLPA
jgi:hypothetical protein